MENSVFLERASCAKIKPYGEFAMREKINKLARGIIEEGIPSLHFSVEKIMAVIPYRESRTFEIFLQSVNGVAMRGLVYAKGPYLTLHKSAFGGVRTKVSFTIDTKNLGDEEEIKGELCFVYNGGEKRIPYSFVVEKQPSAKQIHEIKDFSHLQQMAEEDRKGCSRIFDYSDFLEAPIFQDITALRLYELLKPCGDRTLALEEFLTYFSHRPKNAKKREVLPYQRREEREEVLHFPEDASLEEKITECIHRGDWSLSAFALYKKGVEENVKITKLYENLLYAMPMGYAEELPKGVYLYFSYEYRLEEGIKLPLYYNILKNFQEGSEIFSHFARPMQDYAISCLLQGEINEELALLYSKLILPEMIDERMAEFLPKVLNSYLVEVEDQNIERLVLTHPALRRECSFPVKGGFCTVPMPLPNMILLFQDALGNRYSRVPHRKTRLMEEAELEKKCQSLSEDKGIFLIRKTLSLVEKGISDSKDLELMEKAFSYEDFTLYFRMKILHLILSYHKKAEGVEFPKENLEFLHALPFAALKKEEKEDVLSALIYRGDYDKALEYLIAYPYLSLDKRALEAFLEGALSEGQGEKVYGEEEREMLLYLSEKAFLSKLEKDSILHFLLEEYNGTTEEMLQMMRVADQRKQQKAKIPSSSFLNMGERLLAQSLFTEKRKESEEIFALYTRYGGADPLLLRAFFTAYSASVFLGQKPEKEWIMQQIFEEVRGESHKERVPVLYLLALSLSFSKRAELKEEELEELSAFLPFLLEKSLIFSYTKELGKFVSLPNEILEKSVLEYHGREEEKPFLSIRNQGEEEFHREELQECYHGIYTASFLLFPGESMEYRFTLGKEDTLLYQSTLKKEESEKAYIGEDAYTKLCRMCELMTEKQAEPLLEMMEEYGKKEIALSKLLEE